MEIIESDIIQNIIKKRSKHDSEIFFVDTQIVSTEFDVTIIKKKQYYGVSLNNEIVLPPIYDEIVVLTHSTVAITIRDRVSLYNIYRKISITDFSYKSMERNPRYDTKFAEYLLMSRKMGVNSFSLINILNAGIHIWR